jgi:tetratricopeptide (TPR) repeat protein
MAILFCAGQLATVCAQSEPGNIVITQRWRELFSKYSPVSNPAFLTDENYIDVRGAFSPTFDNLGTLYELGATLPIGLYQSAGVTLLGNSSQLDETSGYPGNTDVTKAYSNNNFFGSYAINPWKGLSVGVNLNLVMENVFGTSKSGFGADLGLSYRLFKNALLGNHILGVNAQNLLAPSFPATDNNPKETYARNLRFTLFSTYWEKRIESNFDYCMKGFMSNDDDWAPDSMKITSWEFTGRISFAILQMVKISGLFGFDKYDNKYFGLGIGVNIPAANQGRDLSAAYQYLRVTSAENTTTPSTLYLRGEFGRHREEVYARKMARQLDAAPNELYLRALAYYTQGKYWEAYFLFSQILNEYPDFFKNDWVTYFAGSCQENLDMREIALLSFNALRMEFPQSTASAPANLASMRVYYRNGDFSNVAREYQALTAPGVSDSIQNSANFIMGQAQMVQRGYQKACDLFKHVPPEHPDYIFAQHSAAIAYLTMNNPAEAITGLQNCISAIAVTPAQKEIVNRSYLYLGYILYENLINEDRPLSKAVSLLRKIPQGSIYYNEALLVLGWTAIKAQQAGDCVTMGQALQNCKNPVFYFEGSLISAYGYMRQGNYNQAKDILVNASEKLATLKPPSEDSLSLQRQRYLDVRASYDFLARKVAECAQKQQNGDALQENNTLHGQQRDSKVKIDLSLSYFDTYHKESFLTRNISSIKEDVNYMLAVVSKRTVDKAGAKEYNKMLEQQKGIDKEIEKLKDELQKEKKK